jgi:hypothetical protein
VEVLAQRLADDAPFDFGALSPDDSTSSVHYLVQESCFLVANPTDLTVKFQTELPQNLSPSLLKFVFGLDSSNQGRPLHVPYFQEIDHGLSHSDGLWVPISNSSSKKEQSLTEGEFIRFGRHIFRVAKTLSGEHLAEELKKLQWLAKLSEKVRSLGKGPSMAMRRVVAVHPVPDDQTKSSVCFLCEDENDPSRPLLEDICDCRDTVHLDCLSSVMGPRVRTESRKGLTFFDLVNFCCPICGAPLEPFVRVKRHTFSLLEINLSETSQVLVLEKISLSGPFVDGVLVVDFTGRSREVLLGSDPDCDIVIPARHASAVHAQLTHKRNAFYVVNLSERFGSLRKLDPRVELSRLHDGFLVSGPFLFSFHVNSDKVQCRCGERGIELENPLAHESSILDSLLMSTDRLEEEEVVKAASPRNTPGTRDTLSPRKQLQQRDWGLTLKHVQGAETEEDGGMMSPTKI